MDAPAEIRQFHSFLAISQMYQKSDSEFSRIMNDLHENYEQLVLEQSQKGSLP